MAPVLKIKGRKTENTTTDFVKLISGIDQIQKLRRGAQRWGMN